MRTCPFTGCCRRIPSRMFCCKLHWAWLTNEEQRTIYDVYGEFKLGGWPLSKLRRLQKQVVEEVETRRSIPETRGYPFVDDGSYQED